MTAASNCGMENQGLGEWEDPWGCYVSWTAEGAGAEAEAGEPWGDISVITDILWPRVWPDHVREWVVRQNCIFQWGGTNDEWDHFSAFQHGWLKYDSNTTLCPDGYCCTSVQGPGRLQGAVGGVASFFLLMLIFSKWAFKDVKLYPRGRYEEMLAGAVFLLPCFPPVIFWHLAGERADFSRDMRLVLRTTAGSRMLSFSKG